MACASQSPDGTCFLTSVTPLPSVGIPPIRSQVYEGIVSHFGDIQMAKIPSNDPRFSMYGAQVPCMCADKRYIFAIAPVDQNPYGAITQLSRINWVSFQTRTSALDYSVPTVLYQNNQTLFGDIKITLANENERYTYYKCARFPIEVQLINGNRGYTTNGTIRDALETYDTIIYFV